MDDSLTSQIIEAALVFKSRYTYMPKYLILTNVYMSRLQTEARSVYTTEPELYAEQDKFFGMHIVIVKHTSSSFSGWAFGT